MPLQFQEKTEKFAETGVSGLRCIYQGIADEQDCTSAATRQTASIR
jgi:hypothetical protein